MLLNFVLFAKIPLNSADMNQILENSTSSSTTFDFGEGILAAFRRCDECWKLHELLAPQKSQNKDEDDHENNDEEDAGSFSIESEIWNQEKGILVPERDLRKIQIKLKERFVEVASFLFKMKFAFDEEYLDLVQLNDPSIKLEVLTERRNRRFNNLLCK